MPRKAPRQSQPANGPLNPQSAIRHPPSNSILDALHAQGRDVASARQGGSRKTFEQFFRDNPPAPNYCWGPHTRTIASTLQTVVEKMERGESSHVIINVPPRHGKSDQVSRRFPVHVLLQHPDWEVMLATASADLSEVLSRNARSCFEANGARYGLQFASDHNQISDWGIAGHRGSMYATSIRGGSAGHGAAVLIIDDYYRNRLEAESETVRRDTWQSFQSDFMPRLTPVHAVIVLATIWNTEDMSMAILSEMKKDPAYPRFERIVFPAQNADGSYLFPERFPPSWYEAQKKLVGEYAWQSLYQCDPQPRSGRMLRADLIQIVDKIDRSKLRLCRGWDIASSMAERAKDDPDYTVGTLVGWDGTNLYICDVARGQWSAMAREARMVATAKSDGRGVVQKIEAVAGYKDCYTRAKQLLSGISVVRQSIPQGDKLARAAILEPLFESGRVIVQRAPWNDAWRAEFMGFPSGAHDDQVDSAQIAAEELMSANRRMKLST